MSYADSIVLFRPKPATHYNLWATIIIIAYKHWSGDSGIWGMDVAPRPEAYISSRSGR